jgi:hypothetical protein
MRTRSAPSPKRLGKRNTTSSRVFTGMKYERDGHLERRTLR